MFHNILRYLRGVIGKTKLGYKLPELVREENPQIISDIIYDKLMSDSPCMIARYGSTELLTITNYLGISKHSGVVDYLIGKQNAWWWLPNVKKQISEWSGFFPTTDDNLNLFCQMMINDTKEVDILGSWLKSEYYVEEYSQNWIKVWQIFLDPFWCEKPWTRALKGKKVLIVHPFAEIIKSQYYEKRHLLFKNENILPDFDLITIKAVQSLGGTSKEYKSWFEALDAMKCQVDNCDYDICLIGCGAYGFPLAAHIKRQGRKSFHLGGSLQLLFGIIGSRWENNNYAEKARSVVPKLNYPNLINEHWIRPTQYKTKNSYKVEGNCYW